MHSSTSPRFPIYGSSTEIPEPYAGQGPQDGIPSPILQFDLSKAFWVQNLLANFAYSRWCHIYPTIQAKIQQIQTAYESDLPTIDAIAFEKYTESKSAAVEYVTQYSITAGMTLHEMWYEFFGEVFAKFRDGYTIVRDEEEKGCQCDAKSVGFDDGWKKSVVDETGKRYEVPDGEEGGFKSMDKWKLKSMK